MWDYPYDLYLAVPQTTYPDLVSAPGYTFTTASSVVVDPHVVSSSRTDRDRMDSDDGISPFCCCYGRSNGRHTCNLRSGGQVKRRIVNDSAASKSGTICAPTEDQHNGLQMDH